MSQCMVLRCPHEPSELFEVHNNPTVELVICGEHKSLIGEGEPWFYDGEQHVLLMGADIPAVIVGLDKIVEDTSVSSGGAVVRVVVDSDAGDPVDLWYTGAALDELREWLVARGPLED